MTTRRRITSPLLLISALSLFTVPAFALSVAEECSSDKDCAAFDEGAVCQKDVSVSGCSVGPEGDTSDCKSEIIVSDNGYCYTPPPTCGSDSDCDEYLSCVQESFGACTGGAGMETVCEEELGESYCSFQTQGCTSDSDCARKFECVEAQVNCVLIDCLEGDEGCNSACEPDGAMECRPQEIECDTDDQCPSDWSCWGTVQYECSGGGSAGSPGSDPGEADDLDPAPDSGDARPDSGGEGDSGSSSSSEGGSTGEEDTGSEEGGEDVAETRPTDPAVDSPIGPDGTVEDEDGKLRLPADPDGEGDDEIVCKEVPVTGYCAPDAWQGDGLDFGLSIAEDSASAPTAGSADGGGDGDSLQGKGDDGAKDADVVSADPNTGESGDSEESDGSEESDESEAGGGCSVAPNQQGGAGWLLGLLLIIPGLRRRFASVSR